MIYLSLHLRFQNSTVTSVQTKPTNWTEQKNGPRCIHTPSYSLMEAYMKSDLGSTGGLAPLQPTSKTVPNEDGCN